MTKTCGRYTKQQISRYIDGELSRHQLRKIGLHLDTCPACRDLARQFQDLTQSFHELTELPVMFIDTARLYRTTKKPGKKKARPWACRFFSRPVGPFLAAAASIGALLFISVYVLKHEGTATPGPSAIVTSIDTDYTAVMILETPDNHHTIIWYSET